MSRILDKRFKYTPSHATDIRKTFRKHRLLQRIQAKASNVQALPRIKVKVAA